MAELPLIFFITVVFLGSYSIREWISGPILKRDGKFIGLLTHAICFLILIVLAAILEKLIWQ